MPPKVKITKEDIIKTAIDIVRDKGAEAINARNVAAVLNCSTQPIFSNFENMDELKLEAVAEAERIFVEFLNKEIDKGEYPAYKASGMAYIRFASEEKELFKLLYMRDRTNEDMKAESELNNQMKGMVKDNVNLTDDIAQLFHLEIWACVHGIATMLATSYLELDFSFISKMITDVYQGLKKQFEGD
ncbi:MAG: TetR/AcrR family transcriptional regulator [Clostridia bacterium]|nr:TetR/AcrR family transcriptional regulator [Clostridia bacterium]